MKTPWKFVYVTPAGGRMFAKNRSILVIYHNEIRLYKEIKEGERLLPCYANKLNTHIKQTNIGRFIHWHYH